MFAQKKLLVSLTLLTLCVSSYVLARKSAAKKVTTTASKKVATPTEKTTFIHEKETPLEQCPPEKSSRRKRKAQQKEQKSKSGWNYKPLGSNLKDMNYEELKKQKMVHSEKKNLDLAAKYLEKMIPLCADAQERKALQFEFADTLLALGQLDRASTYYKEFITLYPSDAKTEEAEYKAIRCSFLQTRDAGRDQSATKEALTLIDKFLEHETYTTYLQEVSTMRVACYEKLVAHEIDIFTFYLTQGDYIAAQKRLEGLEKDYATILPQLKPELLLLEHKLATSSKNTQRAVEVMAKLTTEYPSAPATALAQGKPKKHAGQRF